MATKHPSQHLLTQVLKDTGQAFTDVGFVCSHS